MSKEITIDTVKTFAAYMHLGIDMVYQFTRGEEFPLMRTSARGKILIKREEAVKWMERRTTFRKPEST